MIIQNLFGTVIQGKLVLQWEIMAPVVAVSVQIAKDVEFLDTARSFVLPPVGSVALDTGKGNWFYRAGGWIGDEKKGKIEWSGVYGPIPVDSAKGIVPSEPAKIKIQYVQPALDSLIFHTGIYEPYYAVVDYTHNEPPTLTASTSKTMYVQDWGKGSFDVLELSSANVYSFRVTTFLVEKGSLPPKGGAVKQLGDGVIVKGKRTAPGTRAGTNTDRAIYAADKAILKEATEKQSLRFSSYAEYMQFIAAQARTTERRQRV